MKIGDAATHELFITDAIIRGFADLLGDHNPVHLDDDFAQSTRFGRRIAHGMIAGSLISTVLGVHLPGPGTIYLSQSLKFLAPVYLGDTITARVEVTALRQGRNVATLTTLCKNQNGETVLEGKAVVLYPQPDAKSAATARGNS